jgi:parallel beta-helix repeat protein
MKIFVRTRISKGWKFVSGRFPIIGINLSLAIFAGLISFAARGADPAPLAIRMGADIQAALDALPDGGGEVVVPSGTFLVSNPIVLQRDGQTLRGAGPSTVLKLANRMNCPVVILGTIKNKPTKIISNLRLADISIDGNVENQKVEKWLTAGEGSEIRNNGVTVRCCNDSIVERVTAFNCRSGGLVAEKGVQRLTVRDFTSYGNMFDGLAAYRTTDSTFSHLHLHHNPKGAGISLDLSFNGNVISDAVCTENDLGIFIRESNRNIFQGVVIRKSLHDGVFMAQAGEPTEDGWQLIPGTQCINNQFNGLLIQDCAGAAFHVADVSCTNNVVNGAQFLNNAKGGFAEIVPGIVRRFGMIEN